MEVPAALLKWSELAREYELNDEVCESELAHIMADFCDLQAAIESGDEQMNAEFLETSLNIDSKLNQWVSNSQVHAVFLLILHFLCANHETYLSVPPLSSSVNY